MIGYPVSGHPLDGLNDFILKRSKNAKTVIDWLEKLQNPEAPENTENSENTENIETIANTSEKSENISESKKLNKKSKKDEETATLIGLVAEARHIPTKTGGNMIIATIQSAGFDFTVAVFPRDYDIYKDKIIEDTIVIVEGKLRFDAERGEASLSPITPFRKQGEKITSNSIRSFTITQFHQFAADAGGFAGKSASIDKNFDLIIPSFWTRDDLLSLKEFLLSLPSGEIEVFLSIKEQKKTTKIKITEDAIKDLQDWMYQKLNS